MGKGRNYDIVFTQEHHVNSESEILQLAQQVAGWGWASTWTPAVSKHEGTSAGTAILWRQGLPILAPIIQTGVARATGRTTEAILQWPKDEENKIDNLLSLHWQQN